MNAAPGKHPKRELLHAFGLGKLDDASATLVNQHLETCADCQRQVAEISGDSLLDQLRKANGPAETPAPGQTLSPLARAMQKTPEGRPPNSVPPELANNAQYEILRELGAGGMGVVYLARNRLMDRLEVLKVISTALLHKTTALDRFLQEIRAAASLSHDNVVKAYSALQFGELLVFAMEYVDGDDLAKVVKTQGALPITNACFYARQVALGLQHAHEKNMVHRDIKPHNLILARVGKKHTVKILDFGLAKASSEKKADFGLTGEGKMLGTPDYMAPEQSLDAAAADIRADIYSLGCTLYFLLTGTTPFNASSLMGLLLAHQNNDATALNLVRADVPVELAAIVAKMMAKEPGKRFKTPLEVAQALTPFITKAGAKGPGAPSVSLGGVKAEPKPNVVAKRSETFEGVAAKTHVPAEKPASAPFVFSPAAPVQKPTPKKAPAKVQQRFKPFVLAGIAAAVGVLFLGLLLGLSGVIFRVPTKDGVLVVEVDVPNPDVYVDGEKITVSWDKGGKKAEISVKPGMRQVALKKEGFLVHGESVTLEDGGRRGITARLEKTPAEAGKLTHVEPLIGKSPDSGIQKPKTEDGWVELFNPKDTSGWTTKNSATVAWIIEYGMVIGKNRSNMAGTAGVLVTTRDNYADFHLRCETMLSEGLNSSLAVRDNSTNTRGNLRGYLVRIAGTDTLLRNDKGWGTGSLFKDYFEEGAEGIAPTNDVTLNLQRGKWFGVEVIAHGNRIQVFVDGKKTATYDDPAMTLRSGRIGLVCEPGAIVRFRKIEIKELGPVPPAVSEKENVITTASGLKYVEQTLGEGSIAKSGDSVEVHYTGTLNTGTKFDSSRDRGTPFTFELGGGKVIKGWDEGVAGMKVGGKRKLIIPANLGYGAKGTGIIPPNAELHFEIEMLKIKPAAPVLKEGAPAPPFLNTPWKEGAPAPPFLNTPWKEADSAKGKVDIMFVLDITESMGFAINGVRDGIQRFVEKLDTEGIDARIGMVAFRDLIADKGNAMNVLKFNGDAFTSDYKAFRAEVTKLKAGGGGDIPESSMEGIQEAARQSFRPGAIKILVLITDAPPKGLPGVIGGSKGTLNYPLIAKHPLIVTTKAKLQKAKIDQLHLLVRSADRPIYAMVQTSGKGQFYDLKGLFDLKGTTKSKTEFDEWLSALSKDVAASTANRSGAPTPALGRAEYTATITKVDGDMITVRKFVKQGKQGEKDSGPIVLTAAKNLRIAKALFDKDAKKVIAGDAIVDGLRAQMFAATGENGVMAFITVEGTTVLQILVFPWKQKKSP